jgi:DnaK suppressor protein
MTSHPLSANQRAVLESELLRHGDRLDQQLAEQLRGRSRAEEAADWLAQDGDDAPQRDADREVALARTDREVEELGQISLALQRVHDADFGQCEDCGAAIAFERLQLEPWARRCVSCASLREGPAQQRHRL